MAQSRKNKSGNSTATTARTAVRPTKSRTPFFIAIGVIVIVAVVAIVFKMNSVPKPIVLPQGIVLPKAEGYLLGKPDAPVTIMEFADFECPQCANFSAITEPDVRTRIIDKGLANMRFYDFPLPDMHPNTLFAALTASCAADQGKFWPMHDALMSGQTDWEGRTNKNPKSVFDGYVKRIGLDADKFNKCFDSRENVSRIEANRQAGLAYQVSGTPSFVIGGKMYPGNIDYDKIRSLVEAERVKIGLSDSTARK